ncbi:MAG: glycoside hydrolase family 65 protein [Candidatus Caldatribacteriota bacterium]|nr:glycoside hydrolase family 65 protein [Candidatus Caldatribacteriota bacterium]
MVIKYNIGKNEYRNWIVGETDFQPAYLGKYETIFTLSNGYMGVRAATEETYREETRGCYISGLFDKFPGEVTELANIPDWLNIEIKLDGEKFDLKTGKILSYQRQLNIKYGQLVRNIEWESPKGRKTKLSFERFISLDNIHFTALKVKIIPLNYSGAIEICSGINGQTTNSGVQHFKEGRLRFSSEGIISMTSRTQESDIGLVIATKHLFYLNGEILEVKEEVGSQRRKIFSSSRYKIKQKEELSFVKMVTIYSTRDPDFRGKEKVSDKKIEKMAIDNLKKFTEIGYDKLFDAHKKRWGQLWKQIDIALDGPDFDQLAIRFSQFHIYQMTPVHDERLSIAAKGLSGEGYKGHVFWDMEIFILPFFIYAFPKIAKRLLLYRYRFLDGARKKAKENGFEGAMYPWECADTGCEVTPKWGGVDFKTGKPQRIWTGELEQHITCDIVYSIWNYFQATCDHDFMYNYGLEIMLETSRFWASRLEYNPEKDQYEINDVTGPDEYSEHINNNTFTNYMVKWQLNKTIQFSKWVEINQLKVWNKVTSKIKLTFNELSDWKEKANKIYIGMDKASGFIHQYEGFTDKREVDLLKYKGKVGAITQDYNWEEITQMQVLKQSDIIMLLYLLGDDFSRETKRLNWDYYEPRTLHDSSLSQSIHAILALDIDDIKKGYEYFERSIRIDLGEDLKTSWGGLHAASLGGNWQAVVNGFGGVRITNDGKLRINPHLPKRWKNLKFKITWRGEKYSIEINKNKITFKALSSIRRQLFVEIYGKDYFLHPNEILKVTY